MRDRYLKGAAKPFDTSTVLSDRDSPRRARRLARDAVLVGLADEEHL